MTDLPDISMSAWLEQWGLGRYALVFEKQAVDFNTLRQLTNEDLRELGVLLGHRKALAEAIASLGTDTPSAKVAPSPPTLPGAERRQITVLFCDLVGSTELSSRLDPEDMRDLILAYQRTCAEVVAQHHGFLARYLGDGVLVYFGYPKADENAVERAIETGLAIIDAVAAMKLPSGDRLRVRLGAATGLVVVGDLIGEGASAEIAVSGQVPNLAARLQALAQPGTFVIADATRKLAGEHFYYQDMGRHELKGIEGETQAWQVLQENQHMARYPATRGSAERHLVGRDTELSALQAHWSQTVAGQGQFVFMTGEAGVGKSRLLSEFTHSLASQGWTGAALQCSARHTDSPLYPFMLHLQRLAGFTAEEASSTKLDKLENLLGNDLAAQGAPLLAALLSIPTGDRYPGPPQPPQAQKARTLAFLADYYTGMAGRQPLLMAVEDAHWMDPSSEDLCKRLAAQAATHAFMMVVTARPDHSCALASLPNARQLALSRLDALHIRSIVEQVTNGQTLPTALLEQILSRTDGVPLFAEELTKTVMEAQALHTGGEATDTARDFLIPATLQDSLMARLDNSGWGKEVAQVGATLGRRFSRHMLQEVCEQPPERIAAAVSRLLQAELIFEDENSALGELVFKHALVQDAAYESLLRAKRRELHARIAQVMESGFPDLVATEPELLAHHWSRADQHEPALRYWIKAAQRGVARFANVEAIHHLANASEALARTKPFADRGLLEFNLHLSLGQANYIVKGPAGAETTQAFTRAQELVEQVADPEQRYILLYGIFSGYHFAAKFDEAERAAYRMLELAERGGDTGHICQAHRMLGYIRFFQGRSTDALTHFHELTRLYEPEKHAHLSFRYGADCRTASQGFQVLIDCLCGAPDSAVRMTQANVVYGQSLGHPATLGWIFASAGYLYYFLRDVDATLAITSEGMEYCGKHNIAAWAIHCRVFNLWARANKGQAAEHAAAMQQAINIAASVTSLGIPLLRSLLAEALLMAGDTDGAKTQTETALNEIMGTGQFFFEAMVRQIRGDCFRQEGALEQARDCYLQSAEAARRMGGKLPELRALARLEQLGPTVQAIGPDNRSKLASVYASFTEGHGWADLREVRELLAQPA